MFPPLFINALVVSVFQWMLCIEMKFFIVFEVPSFCVSDWYDQLTKVFFQQGA